MWALADKHPDSVSKLVVGTSFEGREIRGLCLFAGDKKPILLIEGGEYRKAPNRGHYRYLVISIT